MTHRNARLVYSVLFLFDFVSLAIQLIVWKIPTFIDYLNFEVEHELLPNPWIYLFSIDSFLEPWRLASLFIIGSFVFLECRRSGLRNWWVFLLIGVSTSYLLGLFAFLVYREHSLISRDSAQSTNSQGISNELKIYQALMAFGILYLIADRLYSMIAYNYYWVFSFETSGPIDFLLVSYLMYLPVILIFMIERSRQKIEYWWLAIPMYIAFHFIPAFPLFLWLKERSANKESGMEQTPKTES